MQTHARDAYLQTEVMTATPQKLQLMLIDAAIRFSRQALVHWQNDQHEEAGEAIIRAQEKEIGEFKAWLSKKSASNAAPQKAGAVPAAAGIASAVPVSGEVIKVDPATRAKTIVAKLKTGLDNLAIDKHDRIYVSNMVDNSIQEVNPANGRVRTIISGKLAIPGGLGVTTENGRDTLHVADVFAYRQVDGASGKVTTIARMQGDELEYPMSARAAGDRVALSSWFTGTVQMFDAKTGKSLSMLHKIKTPHDAAPMPDGSVIVAEFAEGVLSQRGGRFGELGRPVATGLVTPLGVAVAGNIAYVSEPMAGRVSRVNIDTGEKQMLVGGLKMPEGVALTKEGTLIVAEVGAKRLVEIDKDGKVREIAANLPIGLSAPAGMPPTNVPTGVAVGGTGAIYMTSDLDNAILKITRK